MGARGFQAVWTEVQLGSPSSPCHHMYFRCLKSQFCIPEELRCDGFRNCGSEADEFDNSDEENCEFYRFLFFC